MALVVFELSSTKLLNRRCETRVLRRYQVLTKQGKSFQTILDERSSVYEDFCSEKLCFSSGTVALSKAGNHLKTTHEREPIEVII